MSNDFVKSLLIVEDDSVIASAHRKLLEDNGYEVLIAESGEKAIEKLAEFLLLDVVAWQRNTMWVECLSNTLNRGSCTGFTGNGFNRISTEV